MKSFLIFGCPRSGTKYIATLLKEVGVNCYWERIYHQIKPTGSWDEHAVGEIAWMSLGHIKDIPSHVIKLHQVRNPKDVVKSMMRWGMLDNKNKRDFKDFAKIVEMNDVARSPEDYLSSWARLNSVAEKHADYRYRIEDIETEIFNILDKIEFNYDKDLVNQKLQDLDKKINSNSHKKNPPNDFGAELSRCSDALELYKKYGYSK